VRDAAAEAETAHDAVPICGMISKSASKKLYSALKRKSKYRGVRSVLPAKEPAPQKEQNRLPATPVVDRAKWLFSRDSLATPVPVPIAAEQASVLQHLAETAGAPVT
jgi:hypothetical protein